MLPQHPDPAARAFDGATRQSDVCPTGETPNTLTGHTKMAQITILPTENQVWGFWGTMRREGIGIDAAWELAFTAIQAATGASEDGVRGFLDSRDGRYFADEVSGFLAAGLPLQGAIQGAVNRWMGWQINRKTARETGIPMGLPYLTGWVTHYEILADAAPAA